MKISKLFHWLYAILMMLPVFFIGGRMIYVTFNKNANQSYSGTTYQELVPTYYESNELSSYSDFVVGNIYHFTGENSIVEASASVKYAFNIKITDNLGFIPKFNILTSVRFALTTNQNIYLLAFYSDSTSSWIMVSNTSFDFVYDDSLDSSVINKLMPYLSESSYKLFKQYIEVTQQETLDNAFTMSVNQINSNPLFSWASNSFLIQPFQYITNLFGMPSDSPINTLFSYWLDISIIYLVFDVVMYLPLLAHRWIDKGMIE